MKQTKKILALLVCLALFAGAYLFSLGLTPVEDEKEAASPVVLSEILASNLNCPRPDGRFLDFVEIRNTSASPVDISGYMLSDDGESIGYTFPQNTVLPAGGYTVVWCDKEDKSGEFAAFGVAKKGGDLICLYNSANVVTDQYKMPTTEDNQPVIRQDDGSWTKGTHATPGFENTDAGYAAWMDAMNITIPEIRISEVVTSNRSTLRNEAGRMCDWIELYNAGDKTVTLEGAYLSDEADDLEKWVIPTMQLKSGERVVICCSGRGAPEGEADFSLDRDGCTVILSTQLGNVIDQVEVPYMDADRAWALQEDGSYVQSNLPSPGYENTAEGHQAYRDTRMMASGLIINEVMPSNAKYLQQADGEFYDWVELKNTSDAPIRLADYALSDDPDEPTAFQLPDVMLAPGECYIVICSGNTQLTDHRYVHASFSVSREESWIYLSRMSDGSCHDYIRIYDVPYQHSVGRAAGENGTFYFTNPTPGTANGSGVAYISATPLVETPDGVYNDVTDVTVTLSGPGTLYYTTDGSVPTRQSQEYKKPIVLKETTVIRAVSMEEGKLVSDVVTATYIINENHTLPVISLAAEPTDLFGGSGIYTNYTQDWEVPCNLELYEGDGGFSIDCGLKMYGHTGLKNPKKSFKVNFRGRYGADMLEYPVYGEDGPYLYDSLCIRAGQDYPIAIIRDELFTSLCRELTDKVLAQRDKFCILYVNGEYFGIYCMKEAFNELMYSQNMGGATEHVEIAQAPVAITHEIYALNMYCWRNDATTQEFYDYVAERVDIESLIDWIIMEAYCCNSDVQQNLRYFRSTDNGNKWQYAFYDLDWTFRTPMPFLHIFSTAKTWQHMTICKNMIKNPLFRQQFFTRLSEAMATTLSDENVLARISYYEDLLDPEVTRERARWGGSYEAWKNNIQNLKNFVTDDHLKDMVDYLKAYAGLTAQEAKTYFARWD